MTEFVSRCVAEWVGEVTQLAEIARSEPHCAYTAFRHSLVGKWQYLSRTIAGIESLLQPLEDAIRQCFIPALTNRPAPGDLERELLALPTRLGGLGLVNPVAQSDDAYEASVNITAPLAALIVEQEGYLGDFASLQIAVENSNTSLKKSSPRE